jgi:citrate synthase
MMVMNGEEYLTAEEARSLLGVKATTLYAYVSRGLLSSYRQGIKRQRLYKKSQVESLIGLRPGSRAEAASEISAPASSKDAGGDEQQIPLAESWIPYT